MTYHIYPEYSMATQNGFVCRKTRSDTYRADNLDSVENYFRPQLNKGCHSGVVFHIHTYKYIANPLEA